MNARKIYGTDSTHEIRFSLNNNNNNNNKFCNFMLNGNFAKSIYNHEAIDSYAIKKRINE